MVGNGRHLASIGVHIAFWLSSVELRSDLSAFDRPLAQTVCIIDGDDDDDDDGVEAIASPQGLGHFGM